MSTIHDDRPLLGIMCFSGCVFIFALLGAIARYFAKTYPANELIFFRSLVSLLIMFSWLIWTGDYKLLKTTRPKAHFYRSVIGFAALITVTLCYMNLPLAEASTILFTSPFFVAALSVPVLGEKVGLNRWLAITIGFLGIVIAFNPAMTTFNIGIVYGLLSALLQAFVSMFLREMGKTENSFTTVFYFNFTCFLISGIWLIFNWVAPSFIHLLILFSIGVLSYISQILLTVSHRFAPAVLLTPFNYLSLIWAAILGFLFWKELPSLSLVLGGIIVVLSGLYVFYRETLALRKKKFEKQKL